MLQDCEVKKFFIVKKVKIYARIIILIFIDGWIERNVNIALPLSVTFPLNLLLKCILSHRRLSSMSNAI